MKNSMAEEARLELEDDSLKDPEEKTEVKKDAVERSDIAQKIKYREKYRKAQTEIESLQKKLDEKDRSPKEAAADEKELAAQKYIRDLARREYEEIRKKEIADKATELDKFEEEVDSILEDY